MGLAVKSRLKKFCGPKADLEGFYRLYNKQIVSFFTEHLKQQEDSIRY